ncbi:MULTISPECIES: flagellar motor stator protein MotA [Pseudomonas]|uniref:Flagellar motor stator protein MotA n=1 Tax=Pseudomonas neustonica TaxID=2487346 RepID=A0ABX9XMC8_9PSED|nr:MULTISPECIES: flagellar motor stator protein MotA [Pseudomonas]MBA6419706.1 flagellar motor stator protein MotA [Pseudomonas sp. 5Ae-yellow]ROZ87177.1 flagellar motor stator protein MotA [Pseudomonas sp. SSM44]ROZ88206.1 flagellar motor stator protein MotA [Pseudomonas neustonica]|tara:strand:+ start:279 stop:1133 length:855 start_codon:yes stop_codon:yes gene_type:complete
MLKIAGFLVVIGSVLGGFMASGGHIAALWHPFEIIIIGGAAFGAFMVANSGTVVKKTLAAGPAIMFGHRFNKAYYLDVLGVLYEVLNKSRREGMMSIEADIEEPAESPIFSKYPAILKDKQMTEFICDYLRIMSTGNMAPHELEALFDVEISSLTEELLEPAHAATRVSDALPGFGIVAAVLGIVITMSILGEADNTEIGEKVGTALVGTFLGILAAYGFVGPFSSAMEHDAHEEANTYEAIKMTLVASAQGLPPALAVEFGRKSLLPGHRPSFMELEESVKGR